jgi:Flp pilus assembly protein TadD
VPAPETPAAASPQTRELLNEARTAFALKDYDTAAAKYDTVLGLEPNNVLALSNLGVIRYQQGRVDEAEQALRKATALAPNDAASRALLGVIFFRKGTLEEAFSELTRAVALDPRNAEAHNYLGITLSEKGWTAAAENEIRRALELNPQYADAHFNLAVLYARQRTPRMELARYHYRKALDLGAEADPQLEALLKAAAEKEKPELPKPKPPAAEPAPAP